MDEDGFAKSDIFDERTGTFILRRRIRVSKVIAIDEE